MKKYKIIPSLLLLSIALTSCGEQTYPTESYFLESLYQENFRVLQLTDIHLGATAYLDEQEAFLNKVIEAAKPNYIVITGDSFMDSTTREVDFLYSYFDSLDLPWSIVWGNHDKQGWYAPSYVINELANYKNVVFLNYKDDDVYGDSNYVVNLKDGDKTVWRLIMIDSNSYYSDGSLEYTYDVIHENQVEWYKRVASYNNGSAIPSIAFMHIPLPEYLLAIQGANDGLYEYSGEVNESTWPGYTNTGLFAAIKEIGSTKGVFCGHDHINNIAVDYKDVILSYGVKSTNLIYHDNSMIGGQVITLPSDGSFGLENIERIFVSYEK